MQKPPFMNITVCMLLLQQLYKLNKPVDLVFLINSINQKVVEFPYICYPASRAFFECESLRRKEDS